MPCSTPLRPSPGPRSPRSRGSEWLCLGLFCTSIGFSAACVPAQGGWDIDSLEARYPVLAAQHGGSRLSDAPPYLVAREHEVALLVCRWSVREAIPVKLPSDEISERELAALRAALRAWERKGLGVRFREVPRIDIGIEIRLVDAADSSFALARTGDTIADCAIPAPGAASTSFDPVPAELRFASIYLRRQNFDTLGRPQPLSSAHLTGAALHELGHALGFTGHVAHGQSIMIRAKEVAARAGERVLAGGDFDAAALQALYALPSGTVVGTRSYARGEREKLRALSLAARAGGWRGPVARVGGQIAQLRWRRPGGGFGVLEIRDWVRVLRSGEAIVFVPNRRARSALEGVPDAAL